MGVVSGDTLTVEKIRVVVVDDQLLVRSGLVRILQEESDIEVIAEANGQEDLFAFLRASNLKQNQPDIILLELSKAGLNAYDILGEIRKFYPGVGVLMLSASLAEDLHVVRAIRAGAAGYLTTDVAADELVTAIHEVYKKGRYITPLVAKKLIDSMDSNGDKPEHEKLSNRELQVLSLIAKGKKMKEILQRKNRFGIAASTD